MSVVALVPARGGSKSIPGKNIRPLCGRPLLYWVLQAANAAPAIDVVYVATDHPEIAAAALSQGLEKVRVIERDPATATDTASTESVLLDFAQRVDFSHLALLQATSPMLQAAELQAGCELALSGRYDSVLSAVRQKRFLWRTEHGGLAHPVNYDPVHRPRRQDFEGFLVENGAFYITPRALLLETGCRISGRTGIVEMPEESYLEVDEPADWAIIEQALTHRLRAARGPLAKRLRNIRFVCTDIDGCLTDSGMYYGEQGDELKKFNTRDGKAFELLRNAGYLTGIITAESVELNRRRARKIRADEFHPGANRKIPVMEDILARRGLQWEEVAFLGDDLGDLDLLRRTGISACPEDAVPEVRQAVDLVLPVRGGGGVFRALTEEILAARSS